MATFDLTKETLNMETLEGSKTVFSYATEGIIVADSKGIIRQVNPSAEKLFRYAKDELLGQPIEVLVPRKYTKQHEKQRTNYSKDPHPRSMGIGMDLYGVRKDGTEFPVEISLSPYSNASGNFVIAFIIDITVRKSIEQAVKKQQEELEKLNKDLDFKVKERTLVLEEAIAELNKTKEVLHDALQKEKELGDLKSRFVSMASHEFRTPLTAILSSLSLIPKYGELNEKQNKHIDTIKTSVNNLTDILNDVLSLSKIEEGKLLVKAEEMNIKEAGLGIVNELQSIARKGQKINFYHSGTQTVTFDKKIFRHILFNLISNAIKFSEEGQAIDVAVSVGKKALEISVSDHGIGISQQDQEHLFERFFRAQNAANIQGTGLGLNIVYKYVELLNGGIECKSALGEGTTFIIKLTIN